MKKLMETKPILHAVIWIIIYIVTVNIGDALSEIITGYAANSITGAMLIALSIVLVLYLMKNKKFQVYGMKGIAKKDFGKTLFYVPLILLALMQYTAGIDGALSITQIASACLLMIGVGFIEELVFRGFLFQGISAKTGVNRAILISGITFGIGHIVNLLRGYAYMEQMGQIVVAVGIGIALALLVAITKSIVPGILFHIVFNIGGTITKQETSQQIYMMIAIVIISVFYVICLYRSVYKKRATIHSEEGIPVK
jgi:membrane protease YdiL (CAAX protease family)